MQNTTKKTFVKPPTHSTFYSWKQTKSPTFCRSPSFPFAFFCVITQQQRCNLSAQKHITWKRENICLLIQFSPSICSAQRRSTLPSVFPMTRRGREGKRKQLSRVCETRFFLVSFTVEERIKKQTHFQILCLKNSLASLYFHKKVTESYLIRAPCFLRWTFYTSWIADAFGGLTDQAPGFLS